MAAKDLTQGSIPRLVIQLALPVAGGFALQSAYALADLYFVGRLGGAALAGLSIALNTFFVVLALGLTLGIGALATLSQTYGRGDRHQIPHLFQQVAWMVLVLGGVFWAVGWLASDAYFSLFTTDPEVHAQGVAYFRIYAATFLTQLLLMVAGHCWRAVGDFIIPPLLMGLGVVTNVVLDPLLIFGLGPFPRLEMRGAALATVLSQVLVVAVVLWLVFFHHRNTLLVVRRPLSLDFAIIFRMLRIGVPTGVQALLFTVGLMVVYRVVRPFGGDASAAVGVGFRIVQAGILPIVAIGAAISSLVGQNYGAHNLGRARAAFRWGLIYTGFLAMVEYALLATWPSVWVSLFTGEPAIIAIGVQYLLISGLNLPIHGLGQIVTSMAQGLGRTLYPLLAQVARFGALLGGLALLFALSQPSPVGVFWVGLFSLVAEFSVLTGVGVFLWRTVLGERDTLPAEGDVPVPVAAVQENEQP